MAKCRDEIERAMANAKRTAWDKKFRREWHRAGVRTRWWGEIADGFHGEGARQALKYRGPCSAELVGAGARNLLSFSPSPEWH